jgi:uncharacterized protein (TIGR02599 family)
MPSPLPRGRRPQAFTLVELLVSTAILAILLLVVVSVLEQTQRSWRDARGRVTQFREARVAFDLISRTLQQATLNTYWDYFYTSTGSNQPNPSNPVEPPKFYVRNSELHFIAGQTLDLVPNADASLHPGHALFFQAPLGYSILYPNLNNLLNGRGFYVEWGSDQPFRPGFLNSDGVPENYRFRLMEFRPPSEANWVYIMPGNKPRNQRWFDNTGSTYDHNSYTGNALNNLKSQASGEFNDVSDLTDFTRPVAENILGLVVSPRRSGAEATAGSADPWDIAPRYSYDSYDPDNSTPGTYETVVEDPVTGGAIQGTQHLIPPLVQLTMVAIDETSAIRLADRYGTTPPNYFGGLFEQVDRYDDDIETLESRLRADNLSYQVFSTTVPIRSAKWDGSAN